MKLYGLSLGAPGTIGSPERIDYLRNLDARKRAFVKECDDFFKLDGAMWGGQLARHVGNELLTHSIIVGAPRFHLTYSEYSSGDPDMLLHTRSYLEGCEDGFRKGYDAGFQAATEKLQSLGLKKQHAVIGLHKALKAYFDGITARLHADLFEPCLYNFKETERGQRRAE